MKKLKFIDLFAGLGGFHVALSELGHECVFACELDDDLRRLYELNHGIKPAKDIKAVNPDDIPDHDVLCGGFPCQPFSRVGFMQGFDDSRGRGDLVENIFAILDRKKPEFFILENVEGLVSIHQGRYFKAIMEKLWGLGYFCNADFLSPHQIGIPQSRKRIFIVGWRTGLGGFMWPQRQSADNLDIRDWLLEDYSDATPITDKVMTIVKAWEEFIKLMPENERIPGSRFDIKFMTDETLNPDEIKPYQLEYYQHNQEFYKRHKTRVDEWLASDLVNALPPSRKRLDWQAGPDSPHTIFRHIAHIRMNALSVTKTNYIPAILAGESSAIMITWQGRYLHWKEAQRLQSLQSLKHLPDSKTGKFHAFGNAVNADVVKTIAANFLH